ncbi:TrbC/VirB2 family protein [Shewanella colwelliana]|uniref:TrbC/VirB2 family protein n=1 Tax=Shewanella colwelliana TaxID=23 RepID=UPI00373543F3
MLNNLPSRSPATSPFKPPLALRLLHLLTEHPLVLLALLLLVSMLLPELAHAASSGGGVPWEQPLQKVVDSVTGPVAAGISVLAIVAAGITLVFGGEISGFIKTLAYIALVIALIVMATNVLNSLFGISSTLIS